MIIILYLIISIITYILYISSKKISNFKLRVLNLEEITMKFPSVILPNRRINL